MSKIGIVLLYGIYSEERRDYRKYLNYIVDEIVQEKLDQVILCGGHTNPNRLTASEASTARDYLLTKNNFNKYILEDKSITTNQNLMYAADKLVKMNIDEDDEIFVYGDLTRKSKIAWIAMHEIFNLSQKEIFAFMLEYVHEQNVYKDIKYKNLIIRGFDFIEKSKEETIAMSFTAILDVLALYDTDLEKIDNERRKKLFGIS